MRFAKAPLVELIVEVLWGPGPGAKMVPVGGAGAPAFALSLSPGIEEHFMRFGARVATEGYTHVERLVPSGFPLLPHQAVVRFRKEAPSQGTSLYQLGPGIFTANITPPYKDWSDFRPIVENGIGLLLETRSPAEKEIPFQAVSLRYIDAFKSELVGDRSPLQFLSDVLGFNVGLPAVLQEQSDPSQAVGPTLRFSIPLRDGLAMELVTGTGQVHGQDAVILDMKVALHRDTPASSSSVMPELDRAHTVIRSAFLGMTASIQHLMEPIEETAP